LNDFYAVPIGIKLIGDDAWESGLAAAAHFGAMRDGVDSAVGVDREVDAGRQRTFESDVGNAVGSAGRRSCGESFGWKVASGEDEGARAHHAAQKVAPRITGLRVPGLGFAILRWTCGHVFDGDHETLRLFGDFQSFMVTLFRISANWRRAAECTPGRRVSIQLKKRPQR
jgi:hypothetical protein